MTNRSRRRFLENSMFAAAGLSAAAWANSASQLFANDEAQSSSPNEKLAAACVGVRGRGGEHVGQYLRRKDVEITWIVDIDETVAQQRAEQIAQKQGHKPKIAADMRQALEDKSLDIVSIATPNHWHALGAIWAMQAGKDVYVEKPVSHNVSEGRRAVEVARKYNRICQTGTQCRSAKGLNDGIQFLQSGGIGEIKLARGLCYKRRGSIGPRGEYPVPAGVNYDLWSGPAAILPITRKQFHYDWHWQWPYGNGDLGNQGIHQMDIARWGLGVDQLPNSTFSFGGRFGYEDAGDCANTQVCYFDYGPDKSLAFEVRGLETQPLQGANVGVIFYGTEGYAVNPSYSSMTFFDLDGNKIKSFDGGDDHFGNFLAAVRSRKVEDLNADILDGHLSSALCHLGNISYRMANEKLPLADLVKLAESHSAVCANDLIPRLQSHLSENKVAAETLVSVGPTLPFNPETETFVDNSAADAMLTREYRAPFVVPTSDKI
jgi:predicted dehydrogenase